ncbi:MAG: PH domain-containing protein [Nocardiaceae bacterium]|nr:PH domain-containing protein [Nocardiaceae bacterium]
MNEPGGAWELDVRPRRIRVIAWISATVVIVGMTLGGVLARIHSTGPRIEVSDQISIAGVGFVIAAGILLLTRPRLRANAREIRIRNVFVDRVYGWKDVLGVTFPEKSPWARLELPADEYIPIMAIRADDGESAVNAIERFRELGRRYSTNTDSA